MVEEPVIYEIVEPDGPLPLAIYSTGKQLVANFEAPHHPVNELSKPDGFDLVPEVPLVFGDAANVLFLLAGVIRATVSGFPKRAPVVPSDLGLGLERDGFVHQDVGHRLWR